jgi:hypothetical protein
MRYAPQVIVVERRNRPGVVAGALGCVFGVLGIFTLGLVFVPLAALCSVVGLIRGLTSASAAGIGLSLVGAVLTIAGFIFSPSLWVLLAAAIAAH